MRRANLASQFLKVEIKGRQLDNYLENNAISNFSCVIRLFRILKAIGDWNYEKFKNYPLEFNVLVNSWTYYEK